MTPVSSIRRAGFSGATIALVFIWKITLLLTTAQPVPANDAFFYDGPVVHFLNHGGYFNPAIAQTHPISGAEVFSAYPPLYQFALLAWMSLFGTGVLAAIWFHAGLFGGFLLAVLAIFRQLKVPPRAANLAGLFLLAITFDDRPDGLACLLGTIGVYFWARSQNEPGAIRWPWLAAVFSTLTLCTSLQIGALFSFWIFLAFLAAWKISRAPLPCAPLAAMILLPVALAATVHFGFPKLWAGFLENVHGNASLTGWRVPDLAQLLKVGRNIPAIYLMTALLVLVCRRLPKIKTWGANEILFVCGLLSALMFAFGCLFVVAANWIIVDNYLQVILVGLFLATMEKLRPSFLRSRATLVCVSLLAALVAIRAIGMTTWGVACSTDVNCTAALKQVAVELDSVPPRSNALVSAAYLYEADRHTNGVWLHEDYPCRREPPETYPQALRRLHVSKLLLTQYDFYRRYQRVLDELRAGGGVQITVTDTARVRPPDSYPRFQQVVQHISWAPVIVDLKWEN